MITLQEIADTLKSKLYVDVDKQIEVKHFVNLFDASEEFPSDRIYTFKSGENDPKENIKEDDLDYWHPNQLGNAYIAKVILKEVFGIGFDPEKYIKDTLSGEKFLEY